MIGSSIEDLQRQLAQLQGLGKPTPTTSGLSLTDIKKIVSDEIDSRLNGSVKSQSSLNTISAIIEGHLEKEEIEWLLSNDVNSAFTTYLKSTNGHELIRLFISDFKDFYESQTRNSSI